ncbi:MAG: hypothetical protein AAGA31_06640, partial [Bacteroidota bacterium]
MFNSLFSQRRQLIRCQWSITSFFKVVLSFLPPLLMAACAQVKPLPTSVEAAAPYDWEELIDADLSKWDTYLSYQHQPDYDGTPPKDEQGRLIPPIGLNQSSYNVFTTFQEGEEIIIRNSGEYYGCLFTKESFANYHFQLKFKWGTKKWRPRENLLMDSG